MKETTLCYIEKNNKYLMLHRIKKENDMNKNKWIGVGGKLETGETSDECLIREVREETGLILTSYKHRGDVTFNSTVYESEIMHLYTADKFYGKIIPCNEGVLEWIDRDEVLKLPTWEGDLIFLNLIRTDCPFFNLTVNYDGDKLTGAFLDGKKI